MLCWRAGRIGIRGAQGWDGIEALDEFLMATGVDGGGLVWWCWWSEIREGYPARWFPVGFSSCWGRAAAIVAQWAVCA